MWYIIAGILIVIMLVFLFCACKVASEADKQSEEYYELLMKKHAEEIRGED